MLRYYIIMCRSLTYAQRAVRVLERSGLFAVLVKAPQEVTTEGCNYGAKIRTIDLERAMRIISKAEISHGRIIGIDEDGRASEVEI